MLQSKFAGPLAQGVLDLQLGSEDEHKTWKSSVEAIRPGIPPIGHLRSAKGNHSEQVTRDKESLPFVNKIVRDIE